MRFEIRTLQQAHGITAIYVTHSQDEALAMADVVAVMKDGRMEQVGAPEHLYARPRNRFVAGFIGLANVVTGKVDDKASGELAVTLQNGARCGCALDADSPVRRAGEAISISIRPENIRIARSDDPRPAGEGRLTLSGHVEAAVFTGNLIDYFVAVDGLAEPIRVQTLPPRIAGPSDSVVLSVAPENCVPLED